MQGTDSVKYKEVPYTEIVMVEKVMEFDSEACEAEEESSDGTTETDETDETDGKA